MGLFLEWKIWWLLELMYCKGTRESRRNAFVWKSSYTLCVRECACMHSTVKAFFKLCVIQFFFSLCMSVVKIKINSHLWLRFCFHLKLSKLLSCEDRLSQTMSELLISVLWNFMFILMYILAVDKLFDANKSLFSVLCLHPPFCGLQ